MSNATPALVFLLMLIAPCAIALKGEKKKKFAKAGGPADLPVAAEPKVGMPAVADPKAAMPKASAGAPMATRIDRARMRQLGPEAAAAAIYEQQVIVVPVVDEEPFFVPVGPPVAAVTDADVLLAQAAAAKEKARELAEKARAAQAKARAAADAANEAAKQAAMAHRAAATERDLQAMITAQEQARTASGEHLLPETHPSLDFPRSGRPRRAA